MHVWSEVFNLHIVKVGFCLWLNWRKSRNFLPLLRYFQRCRRTNCTVMTLSRSSFYLKPIYLPNVTLNAFYYYFLLLSHTLCEMTGGMYGVIDKRRFRSSFSIVAVEINLTVGDIIRSPWLQWRLDSIVILSIHTHKHMQIIPCKHPIHVDTNLIRKFSFI